MATKPNPFAAKKAAPFGKKPAAKSGAGEKAEMNFFKKNKAPASLMKFEKTEDAPAAFRKGGKVRGR